MLRALLSDTSRTWTLSEILEATKWTDQVHVAGAGQALNEAGLVEITESSSRTVALGPEGVNAATNGLLEVRIWNWLLQSKESERNMKGLFSAGFDAHKDDPLAQFELSSKDFYEITKRTLIATNKFTNGKVVSILEGGYDLNALAESANEHVNALLEFC